jgi:SagB-type dehydrogenase family enzyme
MNNDEIQISWDYHNGTKHPNGIFLMGPHSFDSSQRPYPYKVYKDVKSIHLPADKYTTLSTLKSISEFVEKDESCNNAVPDLQSIGRILYFSGGITKTVNFAGLGEFDFRAASCTGALYHIEMYLVCGDIVGLEAGVYHFDPKGMKLNQLRKGDYRDVLVNATANDSSVKHAPVILAYTDIITKNSVKYRTREYRHAFWDCGTIISNTLAMCNSHKLKTKVILGFMDDAVNTLLDLNQEKEISLALIPIGNNNSATIEEKQKEIKNLDLPTEMLSNYNHDDSEIVKIHQASSFNSPEQITSWRSKYTSIESDEHYSTNEIVLKLVAEQKLETTPIETTIIKRGSTRKFSNESISFQQLSAILYHSTRGINIDHLQKYENASIDLYIIVNAVENLTSGIYHYNQKRNSLEILKEGNFRNEASHLGLDQSLPGDGSVCIFFMSNLGETLDKLGNRGYRAAQLEASIMGGKCYLAAYSQKIGATGLTFYDDEVTEFFSPHSRNKNAMFMIVLGKKAPKSSK